MWGSWVGFGLCLCVLAATLYTAIEPLDVEKFFMNWLAVPVVLFFWIIGYAWKRTGWLKLSQIDVDTGLRQHDWDEINAYKAKVAAWPAWRRALHKIM